MILIESEIMAYGMLKPKSQCKSHIWYVLLEAPKGLNNMIFVGNVSDFDDYLLNLKSENFGLGSPKKKIK